MRDAAAQPDAKEHFDLWWLGQSGYLIHWAGYYILLDPYLSDSLTKKYAATDKPHVRMTQRVVAPEHLAFVNVVTSSHNHTDHLDPDTLIPILSPRPKLPIFIIPEANRAFVAERLKIDPARPVGLNANDTIGIGGGEEPDIEVRAVPAAHNELERDAEGRCRYLGYIIRVGKWSIYHAGDTKWHDEIVTEVLRWNARHKIDLALLPINGDLPERRVAGNMNGSEAALMARTIGAGLAIPCHYDMFEFNTVKPGEFIQRARELGQPYQILRCGQRFSSRQIYPSDVAPVFNATLAEYYTGKHILVGVTYKDSQGNVIEQIQFDGHVTRIREEEGIVVFRRDTGSEFTLPPDLRSIRPAGPGEYRLRSTGQVVKDPDLLTSWTITKGKGSPDRE